MTGIETRVDGICARCSMEAIGLIVVAGEGWCESCIGRDPAPAGGGVHLAEAAAMLDRCPTCGFTLRCGLCGGSPAPAGAARWVVHVPEQPPSQNAFKAGLFPPKGATFAQLRKLMLGQAGSYGRLVETWRKLLADKLLAAACWKATGRRRVVFTRLMGPRNKAFDAFNAVGGMKPICDALVHLEALVDDAPAYFEGFVHQRRAQPGELTGLRIEITELDTKET